MRVAHAFNLPQWSVRHNPPLRDVRESTALEPDTTREQSRELSYPVLC
jgi:hypothetical protein